MRNFIRYRYIRHFIGARRIRYGDYLIRVSLNRDTATVEIICKGKRVFPNRIDQGLLEFCDRFNLTSAIGTIPTHELWTLLHAVETAIKVRRLPIQWFHYLSPDRRRMMAIGRARYRYEIEVRQKEEGWEWSVVRSATGRDPWRKAVRSGTCDTMIEAKYLAGLALMRVYEEGE